MESTQEQEDFQFLLTAQRHELTVTESMESDLEFAYNLQLQEALSASLTDQPSSSSTAVFLEDPSISDSVFNANSLQLEDLERMAIEMNDRLQSERAMREARDDLNRRIHDQKMASEIFNMPVEDWEEWGDNFEKPFGEGSSSGSTMRNDEGPVVRVYFKGLVSEEVVRGENVSLAGIGVAVCDDEDNLILEISKTVDGNESRKIAVELMALIEGFNAVIALDLKRVVYFGDYYTLFQHVSSSYSLLMVVD